MAIEPLDTRPGVRAVMVGVIVREFEAVGVGLGEVRGGKGVVLDGFGVSEGLGVLDEFGVMVEAIGIIVVDVGCWPKVGVV